MAIHLNDNNKTNQIYQMAWLQVMDSEKKTKLTGKALRKEMTDCMAMYCNGRELKEKRRPKSWLDMLTVDIDDKELQKEMIYDERKIENDIYSKSLPAYINKRNDDTKTKNVNAVVTPERTRVHHNGVNCKPLLKIANVDNNLHLIEKHSNNNMKMKGVSYNHVGVSTYSNTNIKENIQNSVSPCYNKNSMEDMQENTSIYHNTKEDKDETYKYAEEDTENTEQNIATYSHKKIMENIQKNVATYSHQHIMEDMQKNITSYHQKGESKRPICYKPLLKIADMDHSNLNEQYFSQKTPINKITSHNNAGFKDETFSSPLTVDINDGSLKAEEIDSMVIYQKEKEISDKLNSSSLPDITNIVKCDGNLGDGIKESIAIYQNVRELKEQICCRSLPEIINTDNEDKMIKVKHLLQEISESMALYQNVKELEEQLTSISSPIATHNTNNNTPMNHNKTWRREVSDAMQMYQNDRTFRTKSLPEIAFMENQKRGLEEEEDLRLQIRESKASYQRELHGDKELQGQCCSKSLSQITSIDKCDDDANDGPFGDDMPEFMSMSDDEWELIDQVCYRSLLEVKNMEKGEGLLKGEIAKRQISDGLDIIEGKGEIQREPYINLSHDILNGVDQDESLKDKYSNGVDQDESLTDEYSNGVDQDESLKDKYSNGVDQDESLKDKYSNGVDQDESLTDEYSNGVDQDESLTDEYSNGVDQDESLKDKYSNGVDQDESLNDK